MFQTALALFGICLVGQMSPGPDMMLLIRHTTTRSRRSAFGCVLGVCLGIGFHVSLAVLGLAVLIATTPWLYTAIRIAGAAYLVYVGVATLRDPGMASLAAPDAVREGSFRDGFVQGVACNLLNPKVTIFMLSLVTQFIGPQTALPEKLLYAGTILAEALLGWFVFVALLDTRFLRRLYGKHLPFINKLAGVIFVGLGCTILLVG